MSKLDELIATLCPDGVEHKELNSVCEFKNGFSFKSSLFKETGKPILRITNIVNGSINNDGLVYFSSDDYTENLAQYEVKKGDVVVAMSGATTGKIGYNYSDDIYYLNQRVGLFVPNETLLNKRFLYHWLVGQSNNIYNVSSGSGAQPNLSSVKMMQFLIPVPPLEVQCEIVRILDNFTELATLLDAELNARIKQYSEASYRLLFGNHGTEKVMVKDFCTLTKGKTPIQKAVSGEYPMVVTTMERKTCNTYQFDTKAVCIPLISSRGHGVASLNHVYYQEGKFALGNILCAMIPNNENYVSAKYLYYYFECTKDYTLVPLMKGGANVAMHISDIEKVKVPIPPLEVQHSIVSKLERMEEYYTKVLPAEIEARKKQYEYYMNKLLTFKSKNSEVC